MTPEYNPLFTKIETYITSGFVHRKRSTHKLQGKLLLYILLCCHHSGNRVITYITPEISKISKNCDKKSNLT